MHILYLDNIRGFESTYLNLLPVNFFVGENSTGKTSILKLISIISSPGFWLYGTFGKDDSGLGAFSDIITKRSVKEHFELGLFSADDAKVENVLAIKMRFVSQQGNPSLKEINYYNGHFNIQISIEGQYIKYRYNIPRYAIDHKQYQAFFTNWINENGPQSNPLTKTHFDSGGITSLLFYVIKLITSSEDESLTASNQRARVDLEPPIFLKNFVWIGGDRSGPKSNYSLTDEVAFGLKQLLETESSEVLPIFQAFGLDSGLFEEIQINDLGKKQDKESPFEIRLKSQNKDLNISNLGYGVSQILPLIVLPLRESKIYNRKSWIAIQAPEIHLHPLAQAAYGDFVYKCCERDRQRFIIETHSDHTIDRFRIRINRAHKDETIKTQDLSQIVFFKKNKKRNIIETIAILRDGSYPLEQPKEFRQFFIHEQLKLINI